MKYQFDLLFKTATAAPQPFTVLIESDTLDSAVALIRNIFAWPELVVVKNVSPVVPPVEKNKA